MSADQPGRGHDGEDLDAEFAALMAGLDLDTSQEDSSALDPGSLEVPEDTSALDSQDVTATAKAVKVAVVLTPLASADALAALCAMSDLDCTVVPARSGAFAVKEFVSAHAQWDVAELLGGAETEPAEAAELASALSRLSRGGVVLLTAVDQVVEDVLLGLTKAEDVKGAVRSSQVRASRAMRWLGRGLRGGGRS